MASTSYVDLFKTDLIDEKIKNSFNNTSSMLTKTYSLSVPDLTNIKSTPARSSNDASMFDPLDFHTYLNAHKNGHENYRHLMSNEANKVKKPNEPEPTKAEDITSEEPPQNESAYQYPPEFYKNQANSIRHKRQLNLQNLIQEDLKKEEIKQEIPQEKNVNDWLSTVYAKPDWYKRRNSLGDYGDLLARSPRSKGLSISDEYKKFQTEINMKTNYDKSQARYTTFNQDLQKQPQGNESSDMYENNQKYLSNLLGGSTYEKKLSYPDSLESFKFTASESVLGKSNSDNVADSPPPRPDSEQALSEPIPTPTYQQNNGEPHPHAELHRPYKYQANLYPNFSSQVNYNADEVQRYGSKQNEKQPEHKELTEEHQEGGQPEEKNDSAVLTEALEERTENIMKRVDELINQRSTPENRREMKTKDSAASKQKDPQTYNELHKKRKDIRKVSAKRVKRKVKPENKAEKDKSDGKKAGKTESQFSQNVPAEDTNGLHCQCSDEEPAAEVIDAKESADTAPPKPLWYDDFRFTSQYPFLSQHPPIHQQNPALQKLNRPPLYSSTLNNYHWSYPLTAEEVYHNTGVSLQEQEYYLENRGGNLHQRYEDSPLAQRYFSAASGRPFPPISNGSPNNSSPVHKSHRLHSPKNSTGNVGDRVSKSLQKADRTDDLAFKGVDVESEDYFAKKNKVMRQKEYAELLRQHQREMTKEKPQVRSWRHPDLVEKEHQESKRAAALNFAKTVPKPPAKKSSTPPKQLSEHEELIDAIEVMKQRHNEEKYAIEQMRAQIQQRMTLAGY
ncbi:uncharacterized protein LOC130636664 [Hydractinia symbiolongicarpus]|uniref:uncharacterized protein LOC130636664 n=1 Tax=Hydractinia symbiolongicarpus TaxID=13093 RepID=UPI00254C4014|nr:uncharacterized protein LOC130636664 [Hydractinia symbiolongicarpus]